MKKYFRNLWKALLGKSSSGQNEWLVCPFCEKNVDGTVVSDGYGYYLLCLKCNARTVSYPTRQEARNAWDSRID